MPNATTVLPISVSDTPLIGGKILRVALGTLVLTASSWISIPIAPIPITMQTYAVIVLAALFGARLGTLAVLAWLAEAALGLPVLSQGASSLAFFGPSAGYLFSFPVIAAFVGWLADRHLDRSLIRSILAMLTANAINLALGVLWLATFIGWHGAVLGGLLPFWIGGIAKAVLAAVTVSLFRRGRSKPAAELQ
jgi:biotin transport system substrate-specific component